MKNYILDLDKSRELRFGFKAIRLIRQKFGDRKIEELLLLKIDEIPVLAWAGLKWEDSQLTVEKVEDLLDDAIPKKYTITALTEIVINALADQMGVKPKKASAGAPTAVVEKPKTEKPAEKKEPTETIPSTKRPKK